jgi:hypothetical protein
MLILVDVFIKPKPVEEVPDLDSLRCRIRLLHWRCIAIYRQGGSPIGLVSVYHLAYLDADLIE